MSCKKNNHNYYSRPSSPPSNIDIAVGYPYRSSPTSPQAYHQLPFASNDRILRSHPLENQAVSVNSSTQSPLLTTIPESTPAIPNLKAFPSRKQCLCCYMSTRGRNILLVCCLILLVGIGIGTFLLWPRKPVVHVPRLELLMSDSVFSSANNSVSLFINSDFDIYNPNYLAYSFESIDIQAFVTSKEDGVLATTSLYNITLPARTLKPVTVHWTLHFFGLKQPPGHVSKPTPVPTSTFFRQCFTDQKALMLFSLTMDLSWFHWTGHRLTLDVSETIDCDFGHLKNDIHSLLNPEESSDNNASPNVDSKEIEKKTPLYSVNTRDSMEDDVSSGH